MPSSTIDLFVTSRLLNVYFSITTSNCVTVEYCRLAALTRA